MSAPTITEQRRAQLHRRVRFIVGFTITYNVIEAAMKLDHGLVMGLNIYDGKCANRNLADSLGLEYSNPFEA